MDLRSGAVCRVRRRWPDDESVQAAGAYSLGLAYLANNHHPDLIYRPAVEGPAVVQHFTLSSALQLSIIMPQGLLENFQRAFKKPLLMQRVPYWPPGWCTKQLCSTLGLLESRMVHMPGQTDD